MLHNIKLCKDRIGNSVYDFELLFDMKNNFFLEIYKDGECGKCGNIEEFTEKIPISDDNIKRLYNELKDIFE